MEWNAIDNKTCLNCGTAITGKYCHQCGQKATVLRITFKETLSHFLSASFSLEGPLLSTIKFLIQNPGKVFRDFIDGKRKTYYNPVSFFVLLTAIYIIIRVAIDYDPLEGQLENSEIQNKSKEASRYMVNNINYIMFFLIFSIGLMLKLFFGKKYNLAEYTSVGFYICGIYVIAGILFMIAAKYLSIHNSPVQLLILAAIIFYSTYSLFNRFNFWLSIKYLMVSIFSVILYMILGFGFAFLVVSF